MIQLRYTTGSPWVFEMIDPKKRGYKAAYEKVLDSYTYYLECNWRHLLAYLLGDDEMKRFVADGREKKPSRYVMSWLFKVKLNGAKHQDFTIFLTDSASDMLGGMLYTDISNGSIRTSIYKALGEFLERKVKNTVPVEYELTCRYYNYGVAKREKDSNNLWDYAREDSGRRTFQSKVEVGDIIV